MLTVTSPGAQAGVLDFDAGLERMHSDFSTGWDREGGQRDQGHSTCWYPTSGQRPVLPTRELEGVGLEDFVALGKSIALVQWH